jgi:hypothetical protein
MVVFSELIAKGFPLYLVLVIPNLLLAEFVTDETKNALGKLDVPNIGANGTVTSLTNRDHVLEPQHFPGIRHKLLQSNQDNHFRWERPSSVTISVQASNEEGTIMPCIVNTIIREFDQKGATFGKGRASVAHDLFAPLVSIQNIEMLATYLPAGPYLQIFSPYMNVGVTGICNTGERRMEKSDCTNGYVVAIVGRNTKTVARFMSRDPESVRFAEVTSVTSSD